MITETKNQVQQLIEINRALSQDLDLSNRRAADQARGLAVLQQENEGLRREIQRLAGAGATTLEEGLRREIGRNAQELEQMRRELEILLRESESARARANRAEDEARKLRVQLARIEQEREDLRAQVDESVTAMEEIRSRLVQIPEGLWASSR